MQGLKKIELLIASKQTVFTTQDLGLVWQISNKRKLFEIIKYYLRSKRLQPIYKGLYILPEVRTPSPNEIAQKLIPLSYISLSTALTFHGINFQYDSAVHSVSLTSRRYKINGQTYIYHKIKDTVFFNQSGLEKMVTYMIASPERAVCDTLYFFPDWSFDNLDKINKEKLLGLSTIYRNKALEQRIKKLC
jgi:predicted transcriptional regulator of viral defense system